MRTKVLISQKGIQRHQDTLRAALGSGTQADSVRGKILALNRIIAGWCRYYQYTSKASTQFSQLEYGTFWRFAHWLARKHRLAMPETLQRFCQRSGLGIGDLRLLRHTSFPTLRARQRIKKPNPYTTQAVLQREELLDGSPWTGHEERPGMMDLRPQVLRRDNFCCRLCGVEVTSSSCAVDHIRPVHCFKRPADANYLANLWTLCIACHEKKTEKDRRRESRMR